MHCHRVLGAPLLEVRLQLVAGVLASTVGVELHDRRIAVVRNPSFVSLVLGHRIALVRQQRCFQLGREVVEEENVILLSGDRRTRQRPAEIRVNEFAIRRRPRRATLRRKRHTSHLRLHARRAVTCARRVVEFDPGDHAFLDHRFRSILAEMSHPTVQLIE